MPDRDYHIVPHQDGWAVKREGAIRVTAHFETKTRATKEGRSLAKKAGVDLVIHTADGHIASSASYEPKAKPKPKSKPKAKPKAKAKAKPKPRTTRARR